MSYISSAAAVNPSLQNAQAMQAMQQASAAAQNAAVQGSQGDFSKLLAAQLGANLINRTLHALDDDASTGMSGVFSDLLTTAALVQASGIVEQQEPVREDEEALSAALEQEEKLPEQGTLQVVSASPMNTLRVSSAWGSTTGISPADRSAAADQALTRLGDPYSQSMRGSGAYVDCSYLVQWAYGQEGIALPGTAAEQARYCDEMGWTISGEDLQRGDLVFWERGNCSCGRYQEIHHVGIYLGDGRIVEASSSAGQVKEGEMWNNSGSWKITKFARPT